MTDNTIENSYFIFKVADDQFAVPISQVQNILEYQKPSKVPETPPYLLGIANVRGELLPVIDSGIKFGYPEPITNIESCIVSLTIDPDTEPFNVGLLVDKAIDVETLDVDLMDSVPNLGVNINPKYVSKIYTNNDRIVFILNVNEIFNINEVIRIKTLDK